MYVEVWLVTELYGSTDLVTSMCLECRIPQPPAFSSPDEGLDNRSAWMAYLLIKVSARVDVASALGYARVPTQRLKGSPFSHDIYEYARTHTVGYPDFLKMKAYRWIIHSYESFAS